MVSQQQVIDYFESLATLHKLLQDDIGGKKAFFFIPVAYGLSEIDNAIKNVKIAPFLALDAMTGKLDDNNNEIHIQTINLQFSVLDISKTGDVESIRGVRDKCLQIGTDILARIKHDSRKGLLFGDPKVKMRINNVSFTPIGPMALKYYGYAFHLAISCPFGFSVNSATWSDIT